MAKKFTTRIDIAERDRRARQRRAASGIPRLVSNRHGRAQPATKAQKIMFDDYDPHHPDEIALGDNPMFKDQ